MASNGRISAGDRRRVYHPSASCTLEKHGAASFNTLRLWSVKHGKGDLYPTGSRSAYRTYEEQVYFWNLYTSGRGNLAARPGTSNHGWGKAVDLATPAMRSLIDRYGGSLGWHKVEAPTEWWHVNYTGSFNRPNPGTSVRYPVARRGSGGFGQEWFVREVQRRLRKHGFKDTKRDGDFGKGTAVRVKVFQKRNGLKADGIVGVATWRALRTGPRTLKKRRSR